MDDDRILALNPNPYKKGVRISRAKYDVVKDAMIDVLREHGEITLDDLTARMSERLAGKLDGSPGWYATTVKLDLEARGIIQRVEGGSPQRLRLANR